MAPENITDKEIVDWLSSCEKMDLSGQDCGWAFERLIYPDAENGAIVSDVRIATRGNGGLDSLRKAVVAAILVDRELSKSTPAAAIRASRKRSRA